MPFYILYKIGHFLVLILPLKAAYFIAEVIADIYFYAAKKDREGVINNLRAILSAEEAKNIELNARCVFRNFAKYLVDFFRIEKIDKRFVQKYVEFVNLHNMDEGLKLGRGVIGLTAHLGNFELAGVVSAIMGYPINAVVLEHLNKKINRLFIRQRQHKGVTVIPVGASVKRCFASLNSNEIVALVGDRVFSDHGIKVKFLGKEVMIPKGPAAFSIKTGAPIVPGFMIRKPDNRLKLIMEKPIIYEPTGDFEKDVVQLTQQYIPIFEKYIKMYPTQWFMFREFWKPNPAVVI